MEPEVTVPATAAASLGDLAIRLVAENKEGRRIVKKDVWIYCGWGIGCCRFRGFYACC
jgi:hypothetical protein